MKTNIALKRYLERYIEPGLPCAPGFVEGKVPAHPRWRNVLVIPAYDEPPEMLQRVMPVANEEQTLLILVLNCPDSSSDKQTNSPLRNAISLLPFTQEQELKIYRLSKTLDIVCHDLEQLTGPTPANQGVGLARKVGCDIALLWQAQGLISSRWIYSSDADATLPSDYFSRLKNTDRCVVAAVFPFVHTPGKSAKVNVATALYELRLHQYVLGLSYAKSPYAYHTLGSCIAFTGDSYAKVRGYPKRSAAEDFYLLNKLAKLGPLLSLPGECINLLSRVSHRVPFGTGPATKKIIEETEPLSSELFYHPQCFEALRAVLAIVAQLREKPVSQILQLLLQESLSEDLAIASEAVLHEMKIDAAIIHCRRQGKSAEQFLRQFHQWFDGFRSLKFIHAIRNRGWAMQRFKAIGQIEPTIFPSDRDTYDDIETMRLTIRQQWNWETN